ncbi:MAG TPA: FxSxx-COOH system tetratricopeptide repeat protein [Actinocrinis sp.]|nr:FxSxx-COOH system tetratricopeptide repeat protein [Actinocrinis sp.]
MVESRDGQVVTFYSFKGGTGRTMALANVAWILAANGKRVLVVDWDLESPGLHRYFHPFLPPEVVRDTEGVIDLIRKFTAAARRDAEQGTEFVDLAEYARVQPYAVSLDWDFAGGGTLDFMPSGQQNDNYTATLSSLDWDNFYDRLGGGRLFDAMRADMKDRYDYTLIDSRTGFSDISDICTAHLPDTVVDCFTLNIQSAEGAELITHNLRADLNRNRRDIRVLPVPMRIENAEHEKAKAGLAYARGLFAHLPADLDPALRAEYWRRVGIPYRPFYAFEETLAVFGDEIAGPLTLLGAYQELTDYVTRGEVRELPPLEARERDQWLRRYERRGPEQITEVELDYELEDEVWAEWLNRVLTEAGIKVVDPHAAGAQEPDPALGREQPETVVVVVSPAYQAARQGGRITPGRRGGPWPSNVLGVYIAEMQFLERIPTTSSVQLAGLEAKEMVDRVTELVGAEPLRSAKLNSLAQRFPEHDPAVSNLPARNMRFTGRAEELRRLRGTLREQRPTVVGQVAVGGIAGVGKSELALEYAHRYRSLYDVIWWIPAGDPQFVDATLVDLAHQLTSGLGASVGVQSGIAGTDIARRVVKALGRGEPTGRWLLIYDNAEEPATLEGLLPSGAGHVILTSRSTEWGDRSDRFEIDVFKRAESVTHLRARVGYDLVSADEAHRIAQLLGDLPLVVNQIAMWLAETGQPAAEALAHLEEHGVRPQPGGPLTAEDLDAVWSPSLDRVRAGSAAAYRLLEVLAVFSPDGLALELVKSDEMAQALTRLGPQPVENGEVARLVQRIRRFGLITLEPREQQLRMHRVFQDVMQQRTAPEDAARIRREVQALLGRWTPAGDPDEQRTWERYRMLWPHLAGADAVNSEREDVRELLIDRVRYQWVRGDQKGAQATATAVEAAWNAAIAAEPQGPGAAALRRQRLHLLFTKANALLFDGQLAEAYELDREVLAEQTALLGATHRHTLMTAGGLAANLRALGRYAEALKLSSETYDAWKEEYGSEERRTVDAGSNLAVSLRLAGEYGKARELDEIAFEWRSRQLSKTHERTLSSANCIGLDLREAGRYEESVTRLREHFKTARDAPEPSVRVILQIQVNLAASLRATGRFVEAGRLLKEAYERYRAQFDTRDPDLLTCWLAVANNHLAADDAQLADDQLRLLLDDLRKPGGLGSVHPLTLLATNSQVAVRRALHSLDEALALARETAAQMREVLGPDHPYTLGAMMNLAVCLAEVGDLAESRAVDEEAVAGLTARLGAEHPDTLRARANLGLTLIELGEPGAREEQQRIAARLGQVIGRTHPSVISLQSSRRAHRLLDGQPF